MTNIGPEGVGSDKRTESGISCVEPYSVACQFVAIFDSINKSRSP